MQLFPGWVRWHSGTFNLPMKGIVISTVCPYDMQPVYLVHVALAVYYHLLLMLLQTSNNSTVAMMKNMMDLRKERF